MQDNTKSIKIRTSDYLSLEEIRLELIRKKGLVKSKLEMLHLLLEVAKKELLK